MIQIWKNWNKNGGKTAVRRLAPSSRAGQLLQHLQEERTQHHQHLLFQINLPFLMSVSPVWQGEELQTATD